MWGQPTPAVRRAQRGVWGGHSLRLRSELALSLSKGQALSAAFDFAFDFATKFTDAGCPLQ